MVFLSSVTVNSIILVALLYHKSRNAALLVISRYVFHVFVFIYVLDYICNRVPYVRLLP